MPRLRLSAAATLLACALLAAAPTGSGAALVAVNSLILHADGGFQPRTLPKRRFAPIDFQGYFEVDAKGGGKPVALEQAVIEFDRDGRLDVTGLPTCPPERVASAGTAEARRACRGAIVGSGEIEALVSAGAATVPVAAPLTIFNGPPEGGRPTALLHASIGGPAPQVLAIVVPIERRPGPFRYRVTLDLPPIAAGLGVVTRVRVEVGRRFEAGGRKRSYVSARCSDGILDTHGRFTFADGTIIEGSVEKACSAR